LIDGGKRAAKEAATAESMLSAKPSPEPSTPKVEAPEVEHDRTQLHNEETKGTPGLRNASDLGVAASNFHEKFNEFSRWAQTDLRAEKIGCGSQVRSQCTFRVTPNVSLMVAFENGAVNAHGIGVMFSNRDEVKVLEGMLAIGVVMEILSPSVGAKERGEVMMALLRNMNGEGGSQSKLGSVQYSLTRMPGTLLAFWAEAN
jgi:hypothetical protein